MNINRQRLRKLIESIIAEDSGASYEIDSSTSQSDAKIVGQFSNKRVGSREQTDMLNIEGTLSTGLDYSYENLDHLADKNSLHAVDLKRLLADMSSFYDEDNHTESLFLKKEDTRGNWIISSPYADMDKDTSQDRKAKNTKFAFSVTFKNKMKKYDNMLDWYAALQKGGITKEEIQKVNKEIQSKKVSHEDELDKEVKKLNESYGLSRGSLYRKSYRRY
jgi:hypothetical protein